MFQTSNHIQSQSKHPFSCLSYIVSIPQNNFSHNIIDSITVANKRQHHRSKQKKQNLPPDTLRHQPGEGTGTRRFRLCRMGSGPGAADGRYGNTVLATTGGQRGVLCPPAAERTNAFTFAKQKSRSAKPTNTIPRTVQMSE